MKSKSTKLTVLLTAIMAVILVASVTAPKAVHAQNFQRNLMKGKAEAMGGKWTLADWLSQKQSMRLADQWLAANTKDSNWFDLDLSAGMINYTLKTETASATTSESETAQSYQANLYLWLFNFFGEYEKMSHDQESHGGAAGFRLLGSHSQTTSLVARFGYRKLHDFADHEVWENQYIEGVLQMYVVSMLGIQGSYRSYFPSTSNSGARLKGHRVRGGAFVEFGLLRFYADYFQEPLETIVSGETTKIDRTGYDAGIKFYF